MENNENSYFFRGFSAAIIIIIVSLIFWQNKCYSYWKSRGVITPPYHYFWGHYREIVFRRETIPGNLMDYYKYFKSKNQPHGGIYSFSTPIYMPIDIDIVKAILKNDSNHFPGRGVYSNDDDDPLSANLITLEGQVSKTLRKRITPTFTSKNMKFIFKTMFECAENINDILEKSEGKLLDIKNLSNRFTVHLLSSVVLGHECNNLHEEDNPLLNHVTRFFNRAYLENVKLFLADNFPNLMRFLHVRVVRPEFSKYLMDLVKFTIDFREENNYSRNDFMHLLLQLKNRGTLVENDGIFGDANEIPDTEYQMSFEEMCKQCFVFFLSSDTTSTAISIALFLLAQHKEIQDRLRIEICETMKKNGDINYAAVTEMSLLDKVVRETLRMYPPIPYLIRVCSEDYKVPNTDLILEKDQRIFISTAAMHHDEEYFPDPEKFDPERFSKENMKTRNPILILPFGDGLRKCPAERFGMMAVKVALIALLRKNEFFVNEKTIVPLQFDSKSPFVISVKGNIWLNFRKIEK